MKKISVILLLIPFLVLSQTIDQQINTLRNETVAKANSKGRVADIFQALNVTKLSGEGTLGKLPKFTAGNVLGDSNVQTDGKCVGINGFNDNLPTGEPNHVFDITNETTDIQYLWQGTTYSPNGGWANIHIRKARGTKANPQAILKGDYIMSWGMRGYKGNEFASSSAAFQAISTENFTPSANGTALLFQVTKNGFTDNRINGLYINQDGSVAVNPNTNPDYTISTVAKLDNSKGGYAGAATLNPSITLNPKSHQFILLTSSLTQTLPTASGVLGSIFEIKNISGSSVSISGYKNEGNTIVTSIPNNTTIRLVAINNEWHLF